MKKELEDKIVQKCNEKGVQKRTKKGKYNIDVAERLFDYKSKYDMKMIEQMRNQVDQEIKMMKKSPRISSKSKVLAKNKSKERPQTSHQEVVNRLMGDAQRRQKKTGPSGCSGFQNHSFMSHEVEFTEEEDSRHNQTGD